MKKARNCERIMHRNTAIMAHHHQFYSITLIFTLSLIAPYHIHPHSTTAAAQC